MRRVLFAFVALATVAMIGSIAVGTEAGSDSRPTRYIVLYEPNASPAALKAAVKQADGRILRANGKVGVATVVSSNTRFRAEAARSAVIDGVARNVPIGKARPSLRPKVSEEQLRTLRRAARGTKAAPLKGAAGNGARQPQPARATGFSAVGHADDPRDA